MNKLAIGEVCNVTKGKTGITKAIPGEYPLVTTRSERLSHNEPQFDCRAVCVPLVSSTGHGHASIKRIHYQEGNFALGSILVAITSKDENILDTEFLYIYLSVLKDRILVPLMQGTANVSMSIKVIKGAMIDLPSIEKQRKIVKTYQYMFPIWESLTELYEDQQSLINNARESIINLAVQGKLVRQDPNNELAAVLLGEIKAEKERLVKEKKIKRTKVLPPIDEDEILFEIPTSWVFCYFEDIAASKNSAIKAGPFGSSLTKSCYVPSGYKIYGQEQVIKGDAFYGDYYIDEEKFIELKSCEIAPGDILISLVGTMGKVLILPKDCEPGIINPRLVKISLNSRINKRFIKLYLNSYLAKNVLSEESHGGTMNILNLKILKKLPIPLPPREEQDYIVARVDTLMALCDDLEAKLKQSQTDGAKLMEAVVHKLVAA